MYPVRFHKILLKLKSNLWQIILLFYFSMNPHVSQFLLIHVRLRKDNLEDSKINNVLTNDKLDEISYNPT